MKLYNEILIQLLLINLFHNLINCLYEDQIGKFDWRQQFIGRVHQVLRASGRVLYFNAEEIPLTFYSFKIQIYGKIINY